jgi:hypothetical protein
LAFFLAAFPQNSLEQNRVRPECSYRQPPPEADLNANIRTAEQHYIRAVDDTVFHSSGSAMPTRGYWFQDQVTKFGPWKYNHSDLRTKQDIENSTWDA